MLALLTLLAVAMLAGGLLRRPVLLSDPPPSFPAQFHELRDRLNPNTASAAELAAIAEDAWEFLGTRKPGAPKIRFFTPRASQGG